jgi:protein kinase-like protein
MEYRSGNPRGDLLDHAARAIADEETIDWQALVNSAGSPDERDELRWLRVISDITDHHGASRAAVAPTHAATLEQPRSTWGRYTLIEEIGQGSYGSVYRALDPDLQLEIAIKILHQRVADESLRDQLLREGRALAKVQHDNVVRVLGMETHGGRVGLCMEFVAGETLESVVKRTGVLSDREATIIGQDLCRALAAVHKAGFIHRDVKARNVMRQRAGRIVLMDFGTGYQLARGGDESFDVIGTPRYMAPEVLAGDAPSARSDVYSVGVLLYHLVTGEYPVDGLSVNELLRAHVSGRRVSLSDRRSDLALPFVKVVTKALAPDPQERFQTAGALLEALDYPAPRANPFRPLAGSVGFALAIAATWLFLGAVNSVIFNQTMGLTEYREEGLWQWLQWGAKSTLGPSVLLTLALIGVGVALGLAQLIARRVPGARRLQHGALARVRRWQLDDVTTLSAIALIVSTIVLAVAVWAFTPLIEAILALDASISRAPLEKLQYLSPHFFTYHENYRVTFTWVTIASVALWYPVFKVARSRKDINSWLAAGGAAVVFLSVLFLDFPFRLLWHSEGKPLVANGEQCYVLSEDRPDEYLIFCPDSPPPRNRVVKRTAVGEPSAHKESLFSRIPVTDKDWP